MKFAPLFLLLAAIMWAQQTGVTTSAGVSPGQPPTPPTSPNGETKPDDQCGLEGKVVSAATGEPVKKATILLRRADQNPMAGGMPGTYTTTTDIAGKFAMKDIDPGKYRLTVMRSGFVTAEYGA